MCMSTKYLYVRGMKDQRDMHKEFERYRALMKMSDTKHDRVHIGLSKMVTDSAKNLIGETMKAWQTEHFITDWQSAPYSQNQNMVESMIKHLFGKAVAYLSASGFPHIMQMHMIQMACDAMNNIWVHSINTSPRHARFGVKGDAAHFFPPGSRMHVYISEDLRSKGEDHSEILFYCGKPTSGGGYIGFCPKRVNIYIRRHVNIDKRYLYGDCMGAKFEELLKMHRRAREWPEKDWRAFTDENYRGELLDQMLRRGMTKMDQPRSEQRCSGDTNRLWTSSHRRNNTIWRRNS